MELTSSFAYRKREENKMICSDCSFLACEIRCSAPVLVTWKGEAGCSHQRNCFLSWSLFVKFLVNTIKLNISLFAEKNVIFIKEYLINKCHAFQELITLLSDSCDGAELETPRLRPGAAETERESAKGLLANLKLKEIIYRKEVPYVSSYLPSLCLKKGDGEYRGFTD